MHLLMGCDSAGMCDKGPVCHCWRCCGNLHSSTSWFGCSARHRDGIPLLPRRYRGAEALLQPVESQQWVGGCCPAECVVPRSDLRLLPPWSGNPLRPSQAGVAFQVPSASCTPRAAGGWEEDWNGHRDVC